MANSTKNERKSVSSTYINKKTGSKRDRNTKKKLIIPDKRMVKDIGTVKNGFRSFIEPCRDKKYLRSIKPNHNMLKERNSNRRRSVGKMSEQLNLTTNSLGINLAHESSSTESTNSSVSDLLEIRDGEINENQSLNVSNNVVKKENDSSALDIKIISQNNKEEYRDVTSCSESSTDSEGSESITENAEKTIYLKPDEVTTFLDTMMYFNTYDDLEELCNHLGKLNVPNGGTMDLDSSEVIEETRKIFAHKYVNANMNYFVFYLKPTKFGRYFYKYRLAALKTIYGNYMNNKVIKKIVCSRLKALCVHIPDFYKSYKNAADKIRKMTPDEVEEEIIKFKKFKTEI
uniref:PRESAN domain-containing protein n=1 Tax=Parastrongyloides trichosuri TaxID=131310 RepID=A0A0N4Z3G5_PARTI